MRRSKAVPSLLVLCLLAGCLARVRPTPKPPPHGALVGIACSRLSPALQSAVLEAVFYAGGPLAVDVEGWMCGRTPRGVEVRLVLLRYVDRDDSGRDRSSGSTAPVVFENGKLSALGWSLLEQEPERYGVQLPGRHDPWVAPPGWVAYRRE